MGTADLAATVLRRLVADPRWQVILAVSQPDRPKGRDLALQPTPVKQAALELGIPMDQPAKARDPEFIERLRTLAPDLMVVAAYGQLLPQTLLDIPRHGCLNVHPSLLPAYRGAAPIQWALAHGLSETGVTLMRMDAGLDTGPIVTTAVTPILDEDTGQSLHDRLANLGGELLVRSLPDYLAGYLQPRPQPLDGVSLARKITKEDGRLLWERPAVELWRRLRAFTPWPGAFCHAEGGGKTRLVKVHAASLSEGSGRPGERLDYGKGRVVVAAYGQLLPQTLLDIPRHGCLNVHTSLLPAYRGAAPIQWALADGLNETGVTLMRMEAGLDTGPIVTTATTPILDEDTGQSLHDRLADLGGELLVRSLPDYLAGYLEPRPQPIDGVSLARKITKEDGRLVWERPAVELWRRLRAFTPWPGAFCHAEGGGKTRLVKVHAASLSEGSGRPGERLDYGKGRLVVACGRGALELLTLQPEGGRRMDAAAFLAGHPLERFT